MEHNGATPHRHAKHGRCRRGLCVSSRATSPPLLPVYDGLPLQVLKVKPITEIRHNRSGCARCSKAIERTANPSKCCFWLRAEKQHETGNEAYRRTDKRPKSNPHFCFLILSGATNQARTGLKDFPNVGISSASWLANGDTVTRGERPEECGRVVVAAQPDLLHQLLGCSLEAARDPMPPAEGHTRCIYTHKTPDNAPMDIVVKVNDESTGTESMLALLFDQWDSLQNIDCMPPRNLCVEFATIRLLRRRLFGMK